MGIGFMREVVLFMGIVCYMYGIVKYGVIDLDVIGDFL